MKLTFIEKNYPFFSFKLRTPMSGKDRMKQKNSKLTQAVLASTLFCLFASSSETQAQSCTSGSFCNVDLSQTTCTNGCTENASAYLLETSVGGVNLTVCPTTTTICAFNGEDAIDVNSTANTSFVTFQGSTTLWGVTGGPLAAGKVIPITGVNIQGAGSTVTFVGNVNTSQLLFNGSANTATNISIFSGSNVNGPVDSVTAGIGNILLSGSNILNSTVGENFLAVGTIQLLNSGNTSSLQDNVNVGSILFTASNQTLNVNTGVTITGTIDNTGGSPATINFAGGISAVTSDIGVTNPIGTINFNGNAASTLTLGSNGSIINTGTGGLNFNGASPTTATQIIISANNTVTGSIGNTTGVGNIGTVVINNGDTIAASIGGSAGTQSVYQINLNGASASFSGNIHVGSGNFNFTAANQTATIGNSLSPLTFSGNVDNFNNTANDILKFVGTSTTVNGVIGVNHAISAVNVTNTNNTVTFANTVNAGAMNFIAGASAATTMAVNNGVQLNANVDNTSGTPNIGTLTFLGNGVVTGTVGATSPLSTVDLAAANAKVVFQKSVTAPSIDFINTANANSTLEFNDGANVTGSIDNLTGASDIGTVQFDGASVVTGTIGATKSIHEIALTGATKTVNFQNNITVGSGSLLFTGAANNASIASFNNGVTITGNIDSTVAANGAGVLNFLGNGSVLGSIGATNGLNLVELSTANKTVLFGGNILNNTPINFLANATANFSNAVTLVNGNIDNKTGIANQGTAQFFGNTTVNGAIGTTNGLSAVNILGAGNTVIFNGNILNNTPIVFLTDSSASIADGETIFNVDNKTGMVAGQLILQGGATVDNVGATTPLRLISANTNGGIKTINFIGSTLNAEDINIVGTGGTTLNLAAPGGMTAFGNFTTNNSGIDTLNVTSTGNVTIDGNIGTSSNRYAHVNLDNANETTTVVGNIYANNIQFQANNATLQIGNNFAAFGPITTTTFDEGTVVYLGNSSINDDIGTGALPLKQVTIHGVAGTTVSLNANIYSDPVSIDNGGTLLVNGTQTIIGTDFDVVNGVLALGNNGLLNVVGGFTLNTPQATLQVDMAHKLTTGKVVVTTVATAGVAGGNLAILNPGFSPDASTVIPIIIGGAGTQLAPLNILTPSSFLTTFTTEVNPLNPHELDLIVTSKSVASVANQSNTEGVGAALDEIATSSLQLFGTLDNIIEQLNSFENADEVNFDLSTLAPLVDGGVLQESFMAQRTVYNNIAERFDREHFWSKHHTKGKSGYASGDDEYEDKSAWAKIFRLHANQKKRHKVEGYKDDMWGLAIGGDMMLTEDRMLGVALSYAYLDIEHKLLPWMKTRINSYQATVYGSLECDTPWFFNGLASVAYNHYETFRHITFGSVSVFPTSEYHGWQGGFEGEAGYVLEYGNFHAVPLAKILYSYLRLNHYQEKGADTANQIVDARGFNTLLGGAGIKVFEDFAANNSRVFQSEAHIMAYVDIINDRMETTSQFIGAGPSFNTLGFKPARLSANIGASLSLFGRANWIFKATYDIDIKQSYAAQAGTIRAQYDW